MSRAARVLLCVSLGVVGLFFCPGLPASRCSAQAGVQALDVDQLTPHDMALLHSTLRRLEPFITAKKRDGTANLLSWEELYQALSDEERAFVEAFRALKAQTLGATHHYFGEVEGPVDLVPLGPQQILNNGTPTLLDPQFLPREVHATYSAMMEAMERDLGRRLLVESGYRSPAYQLYLFLLYLPKHGYSIRETLRYVALPGYSEHGYPLRQAIDFINEHGINGEDNPEEFEVLPEYQWLLEHAHRFGLYLSYPRNNPSNTAFEPWHWHYEKQ